MKTRWIVALYFFTLACHADTHQWWSKVANRQSTAAGFQFQPDHPQLQALMTQSSVSVAVPLPDGSSAPYQLQATTVMAPALADKYPGIRTFYGQRQDVSTDYGRFTYSERGLDGMFIYQGRWVFVSYDRTQQSYVSYYADTATADHGALADEKQLTIVPERFLPESLARPVAQKSSGEQIRTYRLAISTANEYTRVNGGRAGTMIELVNLVNRINQVMLTDLSIRFELVANNDQLIFDDEATDPFQDDAEQDLDTNQSTIDDIIGSANYDIGHLLNTNPGGLAVISGICVGGFKAKAYSGSFTSSVSGESFYIDLVAHELGHQLGARHTWNALDEASCSADQRSPGAAVEPGSGSTIMSYAGLCGSQDLQGSADPQFHAWSIDEIRDNIDTGSGGNCGTLTAPGNAVPVITLEQTRYTVPANTPLKLSATATDADNDNLTFSWEQINPGQSAGATANRNEMINDNGANPLFRTFSPVSTPVRYLPRLTDVLRNTLVSGEVYPQTTRSLRFELVARDGVGGVDREQLDVDVVAGDGFTFTEPVGGNTLNGGRELTLGWQVGNTNNAPISCSNVDVWLDVNGANQFDTLVADNVPNTGSASIILTNTEASTARLMLMCSDNIFYAVNPQAFAIQADANPQAPLITGQRDISILEDGEYTLTLADLVIDDPDTPFPAGFTLVVNAVTNGTMNNATLTPDANFNGSMVAEVQVNDGTADSNSFPVQIQVLAQNDAPEAVDDTFTVQENSTDNTLDVLANDSDIDSAQLTLQSIEYNGTGSLLIQDNQLVYTPAADFTGSETFSYQVTDTEGATAQGAATITVAAEPPPAPQPPAPTPDSGGGGSFNWLLMLFLFTLLGMHVPNRRGN